MSTDEARGRGGTLESGLDIIEALVERTTPAGVTELSAALGMDKGNLHRLLKVLEARGWVIQDPETRRYTPTAHIIGLAGALLRKLDLRNAAEGVCARLLERTGESIHLSVVTSTGPVYVLQRRPPFRVSIATEVGARPPLHATATGKSILAYIDDQRRSEWLTAPFEKFTYRTHGDLASLERDLAEIRTRGFAIDDEEFNPGARCVAVPIFGLEGEVIGCVGISTPTQRVSFGDMTKLADACLSAAREITQNMGGPVDRHPEAASWIEAGPTQG
ncbi:IclR family transcriptional regulator [Paractinoplanes durhamensis]|uniref:IclR family transcriptional regulator n=1 Tax=Paractinoplanes durhamensis TaxID=113563 RepID=A0ABQ3YU02_9ACTN|nr:IclR family transcriptional regulator [Actinoplanes durhamensis]GIE01095.1 IclR family transcriptional regulator [Actinoplanes durhamensis]